MLLALNIYLYFWSFLHMRFQSWHSIRMSPLSSQVKKDSNENKNLDILRTLASHGIRRKASIAAILMSAGASWFVKQRVRWETCSWEWPMLPSARRAKWIPLASPFLMLQSCVRYISFFIRWETSESFPQSGRRLQ